MGKELIDGIKRVRLDSVVRGEYDELWSIRLVIGEEHQCKRRAWLGMDVQASILLAGSRSRNCILAACISQDRMNNRWLEDP